ncbi:MAG: saccharopine dehydrogenase NADP-binding domain-containing protein [Gemmatimonadales bacterium]|nr:MAG: saccharopine dehydrogenase NADP-binding domain-containing protein [Gemmatimonadales bacterium]
MSIQPEASPGTDWLLYGAYGFTGKLIAQQAVAEGLDPILAGRDGERTRAVAQEFGLRTRIFPLDDPTALREGLRGVSAVVHAAGPFYRTWRPVTEACLAEGCHYLDVTGEIDVLEGIRARNDAVREAGLHFIPAVGFDVVPTDCAATLAAESVEAPAVLDLAFHMSGGPSRGTARTALERLGSSGAVRKNGRIVPAPLGSIRRVIPFSDKPRPGVAIPWGDVSTAYHSTGIPDIRVFAVFPDRVVVAARLVGSLMKLPPVRALARLAVDALVEGPDDEELERGYGRVWAEARNEAGEVATVELLTPNGYVLTARAAVAAVREVLAGQVEVEPGVHTPSRAFGADFVLRLDGVRRTV